MAEAFARAAGAALAQLRLAEEQATHAVRQSALLDAAQRLNDGGLELAAVLQTICTQAAAILDGDTAAVYRREGPELRIEAATGLAPELLGYVPLDAGLFDLYRDADVFLHISWTEGLPQVLLEAFAARLPVVATDVGGVGPVARGAAELVPPGDAEAAAAAVQRLVADPARRDRLVEVGVQRVRERTAEAERRRLVTFVRG